VRVPLLCTVRSCLAPLARAERRFVCANGHSFDLARSGYLNLLQPQDRRSATPGDTPSAVAARRRFLDRHGSPLDLARWFADVETLLDVGCGEGHHFATLPSSVEQHGTDISIAAIDAAARRYRDAFFVVANADRFLPYGDASFGAIASITARMNPPEFRRVLAPGGRLLVALPAPDDLLELRTAILGAGEERDRVPRTIDLFAPFFALEHQERVAKTALLDRTSIEDVMTSSYRGLRTRERERMAALEAMEVTMSRDVLLFVGR
jgi:23S rRNA (guanine745-N1)-methyltransferase